jgi:hypothetical protein
MLYITLFAICQIGINCELHNIGILAQHAQPLFTLPYKGEIAVVDHHMRIALRVECCC